MDIKHKIEQAENSEYQGNMEEENSFDFRTILKLFILNWHWFAVSMFIFLCGAVIYLKYKKPIYQVSAKMLVKDESNKRRSSSGQMLANMQDLGIISNSNGIDNEVEILHSRILAKEAVKDLKLYTEYEIEGRFVKRLLYNNQPINVDINSMGLDKIDEEGTPIEIEIKLKDGKYLVKCIYYNEEKEEQEIEKSFNKLPASFAIPTGTITLTKATPTYENKKIMARINNGRKLFVSIIPPTIKAATYVANATIEPTSKTTSIALITLRDNNWKRADDYLRQLAVCYNRQANLDKNEIALKTEEFINGRLEKINAELGLTEGELERYKKNNNLTNLKLDATETLAQTSQYSTKLSEAKSQIMLLDYLREYVKDPNNKYQIIPSNIGLEDNASTSLINNYNKGVLERNRLLRSASELSPQVQNYTATLDELDQSIRVALNQARKTADIKLQGVEAQYSLYQGKVSNAPEQERMLTQIGRQQEVKSELYLMLLQKREENSISLAATADKGKLIDEPIFMGKVSPKFSIVLLISLAIGFALPLIFLYIIQLLRYKIEAHEDVEKLTSLPIIADVAIANESSKTTGGIVVKENQNNQMDEIFRSMRTNIQFMLKEGQKVIMLTSSTSGEGKTFNAANLAVSYALLGKKVILMGLDIRKPALGRLFGLRDRKMGVTSLLTLSKLTEADINANIVSSTVNDNLDIMLAGPVPPNPTELLANGNMKQLVEYLRSAYDIIIMDTAPVGLVTDTLQIGLHADVTVVVCRADYTPKSAFEQFNNLAKSNQLKNMCVVINGIDMTKKKYGYYYGYGKYGKYGKYMGYNNYSTYGSYSSSHYGNPNDNSIKQ